MTHTEQFEPQELDRLQSILFHARDRRRSLAGVVDLFRTHQFSGSSSIAVSSIGTAAVFPDRSGLVTFATKVRVTGAVPLGLVFEFGSTNRGCGVGFLNTLLAFSVGGATVFATAAIFNNVTAFPIGQEIDIVCACNPGNGKARLWLDGEIAARSQAAVNTFGGDWADTGDGSFAAVGAGTVHANLAAANQAPSSFEVIEPLSVFVGAVPRHFNA